LSDAPSPRRALSEISGEQTLRGRADTRLRARLPLWDEIDATGRQRTRRISKSLIRRTAALGSLSRRLRQAPLI